MADNQIRVDLLNKLRAHNQKIYSNLEKMDVRVEGLLGQRMEALIEFLKNKGLLSPEDILEFNIEFEKNVKDGLDKIWGKVEVEMEAAGQKLKKEKASKLFVPGNNGKIVLPGQV
jgi:hypothetical protein